MGDHRSVGECAGDVARSRYTEGRNCAEAVLASLSSRPGVPPLAEGAGSGFTSGIGNTGCVCGALAGGVMVLSAFVASQGLEPVAQRMRAEELSAEFLEKFKDEWGATCCRSIKCGMTEGSAESAARCASITEFSAALAADMVARSGPAPRAWVVRDAMNAVRRSALDVLAGSSSGLLAAIVMPAEYTAIALLGGSAIGLAVGALAEWRGAASRSAGRLLRAAGIVALAVLATAAVFAPSAAGALLRAVFGGPGVAPGASRGLIALAATLVALLAIYEYRRFR
ncbi:MAG: C-GCAxxG-C-C family protein [Coriobacteriia bacterium]|nr:C-GCAxxG-C-C family protein [Coriobacteriia bacterium]